MLVTARIEELSDQEEVMAYFRSNLRAIEEMGPSDAKVSGSVEFDRGEVEVTIQIGSAEWGSICRKRGRNPYIAIDTAVSEMKSNIVQWRDMIDWSMF